MYLTDLVDKIKQDWACAQLKPFHFLVLSTYVIAANMTG